jgi:hypothetical protein
MKIVELGTVSAQTKGNFGGLLDGGDAPFNRQL